jgi:hypothetical protein
VKALRGTAWAEHDCRHQCGGLAGYCGVEGSRDLPSYKPSIEVLPGE